MNRFSSLFGTMHTFIPLWDVMVTFCSPIGKKPPVFNASMYVKAKKNVIVIFFAPISDSIYYLWYRSRWLWWRYDTKYIILVYSVIFRKEETTIRDVYLVPRKRLLGNLREALKHTVCSREHCQTIYRGEGHRNPSIIHSHKHIMSLGSHTLPSPINCSSHVEPSGKSHAVC